MLGNVQGWVISAVIALVGGYGLWVASQPPRVSEPSGVFPKLLSPVALPIEPKSVSPLPMSGACDAGEKYRAAIAEYQADAKHYDVWSNNAKAALDAKPHAVELVVEAADCGTMNLFRRSPGEVISYDTDLPPLEMIDRLGRMCVQRGMLLRKTQPDDARRYLAAAFALGYRLYSERLVWQEFNAGINLMTDAAKYLRELEPDPGRARSLELFADAADKYKQEQLKLYGVINTADGTLVGRYGGDVYALARSSPEPMWRTAAILAVGRMKYNTPRRGDQLAAPRELKAWAADPDPVARTAAKAASDLTIERYRMLR